MSLNKSIKRNKLTISVLHFRVSEDPSVLMTSTSTFFLCCVDKRSETIFNKEKIKIYDDSDTSVVTGIVTKLRH
jgi:hypothetical protein